MPITGKTSRPSASCISTKLQALPASEQDTWVIDAEINDRGVLHRRTARHGGVRARGAGARRAG